MGKKFRIMGKVVEVEEETDLFVYYKPGIVSGKSGALSLETFNLNAKEVKDDEIK